MVPTSMGKIGSSKTPASTTTTTEPFDSAKPEYATMLDADFENHTNVAFKIGEQIKRWVDPPNRGDEAYYKDPDAVEVQDLKKILAHQQEVINDLTESRNYWINITDINNDRNRKNAKAKQSVIEVLEAENWLLQGKVETLKRDKRDKDQTIENLEQDKITLNNSCTKAQQIEEAAWNKTLLELFKTHKDDYATLEAQCLLDAGVTHKKELNKLIRGYNVTMNRNIKRNQQQFKKNNETIHKLYNKNDELVTDRKNLNRKLDTCETARLKIQANLSSNLTDYNKNIIDLKQINKQKESSHEITTENLKICHDTNLRDNKTIMNLQQVNVDEVSSHNRTTENLKI
jgi:hypothetical protein